MAKTIFYSLAALVAKTIFYSLAALVAKTIFYSLAALIRKILFCHSKIKFITSRHHVISSIHYQVRMYDHLISEGLNYISS